MTDAALPLDGVRILAFTQLGAGPFGMMMLSDLGAEVVKVEQPDTGGDEARTAPPFNDPAARDGLYYQAFNRGTRSLTLNVRNPEGHALLRRLAPRFNAVFNNLRGDLTAGLGLDYASLRDVNPALVCCSLSGFGRTGPRAGEPAYDYLLQAYAGFMSLTGEPDAPPTKCGISIVDFAGGMLGALALMIGLYRARAQGVGGDVDVALLDAALSMLNYMGTWTLNRDWAPERHPGGAHQSLLPSQSFETKDGWLVIMVMKEKFWERLIECLDRPELGRDPRFRTFADRLEHRTALGPLLEDAFRTRTTDDWLARLRGQVPVAPVYSVDEALADEHARSRDMVAALEHPIFGALDIIGCPIKIADAPPRYTPGSPLGADTVDLLAEIGVSADEVDDLRTRGIV